MYALLEFKDVTYSQRTEFSKIVASDGREISGIIKNFFAGKISDEMFLGNHELINAIIPNSVTSIGNFAFYNCKGLTSITIPDSVTSIEYGAFAYCTGLTSITIPDSVTSIGNDAFYGCTNLTSITIGSGVTSIGNKALCGCTRLTSITWRGKSYISKNEFNQALCDAGIATSKVWG